MTDRPVLHALVGYFCAPFGVVGEPRMMPLEDAADYQRFGFVVLVDPEDEAALVRHEQIERSLTPRRKWYE